MSENVLIIGAGSLGRAIAEVLKSQEGLKVSLFDSNPALPRKEKSLAGFLSGARFVFFCVPSWVMRKVVSDSMPYLEKGAVVISPSKGFDEQGKRTIAELLAEFLKGEYDFGIIAGPLIADELQQNISGKAVFASYKKETYDKTLAIFKESPLSLEYSSDTRGVALASVLKNIYAILIGMSDGCNWGANMKSSLIVRSLREMAGIIKYLKGREETVYELAGLGDLLSAGFSSYSHNRQVGYDLITRGKYYYKSEGVIALSTLLAMLGVEARSFSLLMTLAQVIQSGVNSREALETFLTSEG